MQTNNYNIMGNALSLPSIYKYLNYLSWPWTGYVKNTFAPSTDEEYLTNIGLMLEQFSNERRKKLRDYDCYALWLAKRSRASFSTNEFEIEILVGSSHSLLLLWLVRVITSVMFLSITIWKPLYSKLFTELGWEQVPLHFPDKNKPFKSATDSATASSGGGSMALLKNAPISPSLRSLMVRASSWRGVRRISGVACSASLSKRQHSWFKKNKIITV